MDQKERSWETSHGKGERPSGGKKGIRLTTKQRKKRGERGAETPPNRPKVQAAEKQLVRGKAFEKNERKKPSHRGNRLRSGREKRRGKGFPKAETGSAKEKKTKRSATPPTFLDGGKKNSGISGLERPGRMEKGKVRWCLSRGEKWSGEKTCGPQ